MSPSVSVVIPVLDDAEELHRCLELLAAQSVAPHEIVVVDNGCTDDSAAIAIAYGARVVHEPHRGIPSATARGYDAAGAEVLARLDADSRPGPNWIRDIGRTMADPEVDAVTGTGYFHDLPVMVRPLATLVYLGAYYALTYLALGHMPVWGSSMAVRRSTWAQVSAGVHRFEDVHDDMDLAFALGPSSVIRFDRRLRVGVSSRSLRGAGQLGRRLARATTTLRLNWAISPPWERWHHRSRA